MANLGRNKKAVESCPVFIAAKILGRRWAILILQMLIGAPSREGMRFNAIHREIRWVSAKVLTERLRELENEGLLSREIDNNMTPPSVTYALTEKGEDLRSILEGMQNWGLRYGGKMTRECLGGGFSHCDGCRDRRQG